VSDIDTGVVDSLQALDTGGRLEKRKSHEQTISVPQKVMLGDVWKWLCCAGFEAIELLLITLCRPG
jgi:hypothetical protein